MAVKITRKTPASAGTSAVKTTAPAAPKEKKKTSGVTITRKNTDFTTTTTPTPQSTSSSGVLDAGKELNFFQRVGNALSGALKSTAADYSNVGATAYQGGQAGRTARNQELLEEYQYSLSREQKKLNDLIAANKRDPKTFTASDIESQQYIVDDWQRKVDALGGVVTNKVQEKATQEAYKAVDTLQESAQKDITTAKQGLGKVGQFVVDAGVAGAQMAGDIAVGALVGFPMASGKGKLDLLKNAVSAGTDVALASRIFGGSTAQARREGATYGQQVGYGVATAAAGVLLNKLANTSGVFKTAFGKGLLDDALSKVASKPLGKLAVSALSEGGEEMIENALDPLLQKITYNPDAAYDAEWLAETLYSGAIGAALGGVGALADASTYKPTAKQAETNPLAHAQGNAPEATTDAPEINAPQIAENEPQTMPTEEMQKPAVEAPQPASAPQVGDIARPDVPQQQAKELATTTDDGLGAANASWFEANKTDFDHLVDQSTEFHDRGANPRDDIYFEVPKKDVQGRNISRSASNIVGAKAIPADVVPDIEQLIADGKMSYNKLTDKKSLFRAEMTIRNQGFDGAMERFRSNALKGKIDKDTVSLGFTLLNNAANARDGAAVAELCGLIQSVSTNAGQALQAFNILRKMSPEAQLYSIQKMVDNLNENVKRKKPRKGSKDNGVPVDQWMQKTGEMLATQLGESVKTKPEKVQTVSQRVLADLRKLAKETVAPAQKAKSSRTEMDSIYDMFNNQEQYEKALAAAKETVAKEYGDDPEVMAALDEWMNSALDYTLQFTKEVTGQGDIKVSNELMTKFLEQTTDEGRDAVKEEIYAEIASQIPSTFAEKWNSWRYMSMLVNPRTHIRNIAGNTFFQPVRFIKNEIAAGLEAAWAATGHDIQRTKSAATSPALYKAAWADFDNVKTLVAGNKYSDSPMNAIQDKRKIYKNKALEFVRSMNMIALSAEDTIFKRITYADALAGYLKANGVTAEQMQDGTANESILSAARDYAAQEALKATYQDNNAISDKTTQIVKSLGAFGEAVMPFKKTPANVLARSLEYSPVGLIKGLTYDLHKVQSGDMSISQAFDDIAAGVTGTSIFVLGAILAAKGILRGKQGDEEEDKWDELLGHQGYAVELPNGTSITLDWLAPAAMPLFMGAEFMSSAAENGFSAEDIQNTLYAMSDPLLEMSMLQSLNDMIESVGYAKTSGVVSVIGSAISSYFSQAIPTLFGQIERVGEDERMTAYTDKNSALPTDLQYFLSKASAKIPGVDYQQIPYIDAWGRTEETGNLFERSANNFFNPAYVSKVDMDSVESAIQKVYDATGESGVFPERAERSIDVGKGDARETKHLTADQYVHYAKTKGQKSYQYAKEAIATDAYRSMTQEERADYIAKMYGYADYKAKRSIFSNAAEGNTEYPAYAEAEKKGISPAEFYFMKDAINNDVKGIPDEWGNTKSGTYKDAVEDYINDQDLTPIQKDWLLLWKFKSTNKNPEKAKAADAKTLREAPWN